MNKLRATVGFQRWPLLIRSTVESAPGGRVPLYVGAVVRGCLSRWLAVFKAPQLRAYAEFCNDPSGFEVRKDMTRGGWNGEFRTRGRDAVFPRTL